MLKSKKAAYQLRKDSQIGINDYKNLARACRDEVRKARAQLELKLDKDVKSNNKERFRYVSSKQKHREDIDPLLNRTGKLVTNKADKVGSQYLLCLCLYRRSWTPDHRIK